MVSYQFARNITIAGYVTRTLGISILFGFGLLSALLVDAARIFFHTAARAFSGQTTVSEMRASVTTQMRAAFLPPIVRHNAITSEESAHAPEAHVHYSPTAMIALTSTGTMLLLTIILAPMINQEARARLSLELLGILFGTGLITTGGGSTLEQLGETLRPTTGQNDFVLSSQYASGNLFLPAPTPPPTPVIQAHQNPLHGSEESDDLRSESYSVGP